MRKLTPAELAEPDVQIEISYEKWDKLPGHIREDLRPFGQRDTGCMYILRVPAYHYRQLIQEAEKVTP